MPIARVLERVLKLNPLVKTGLVLAGYVAAFMLASLAYDIRIAHEDPADVQASGGMYAFGDGMYFLFVFALCASVPTAAGLWFLRQARRLWSFLTAGALLIAATAVASALVYSVGILLKPPQNSMLGLWTAIAVLPLLFTPIMAGAFLVFALLAPDQRSRSRFLTAMTAEALSGALIFIHLVGPFTRGVAGH